MQFAAMESLGIEMVSGARLAQAWGRVKGVPAFLFVRGNRELVLERGIGVVGARRGVRSLGWVFDLAGRCAQERVPVVSGGALGVDAAAHWGALEAGGGNGGLSWGGGGQAVPQSKQGSVSGDP